MKNQHPICLSAQSELASKIEIPDIEESRNRAIAAGHFFRNLKDVETVFLAGREDFNNDFQIGLVAQTKYDEFTKSLFN